MKKIHRYIIPLQEKTTIDFPENAVIINTEDCPGIYFIIIWAIVDTGQGVKKEQRHFEIYRWNQEIKTPLNNLHYLGTGRVSIGSESLFSYHIFERHAKIDRKQRRKSLRNNHLRSR